MIALKPGSGKSTDPFADYPISVSSSVGYEIQEFLAWEALLLDNRRYTEWSELLAHDFAYHCPGRSEDARSQNDAIRLLRAEPGIAMAGSFAQARRFLSNIIVTQGARPHEFAVASYVLIHYRRPEDSDTKALTVARRDCLLHASNRFRILRREIQLAQMSIDPWQLVGPL